MKTSVKNAIYAILSIVIIIPAIILVHDYIYFQEPLSRVALYPDDPKCNKECVQKTSDAYKCVEIKQDEFVCRTKRGDTIGEDAVHSRSAGPISYGEIVGFPEGKPDVQWFNVASIRVIDRNSKTIQVDFNEYVDGTTLSDVIYTAKLTPNDTYLSCNNPWKATHLVRYVDLFEYENKTYVEFWGMHPFTPQELFPCDVPKMLEYSLSTDYDDILLPEYVMFGFD